MNDYGRIDDGACASGRYLGGMTYNLRGFASFGESDDGRDLGRKKRLLVFCLDMNEDYNIDVQRLDWRGKQGEETYIGCHSEEYTKLPAIVLS